MYPYLTIFGHTVTTYGILIIAGFAAGAVFCLVHRKVNEVSLVDLVACLLSARPERSSAESCSI
ncbi:hypothetical protein [Christensenella massiliensis]|uniref:Prolipoprotein diacylglyceryl transferase n=1 Tax=Christensenella massiliensis TaxID=1805714 RepID=A0AAU8A5L0_9FIRM